MFTHVPFNALNQAKATTYKNGDRYYTTPNGKKYPSVTTILKLHSKEGIDSWRKRVGKEEAAKVGARAGARGNRIHGLIEKTLNNQSVSPNIFDMEMYQNMMKHVNRINNIRLQEVALYSHKIRLGGRCDCVAEFDGIPSIIDFKSSLKKKKVEWIEGYCMQVAAYSVMYKELYKESITQGVIIMGVDDEKATVFKVKTKDWIEKLVEYRDLWEEENRS